MGTRNQQVFYKILVLDRRCTSTCSATSLGLIISE